MVMQDHYQGLFSDLSDESRLWIFQSTEPLSEPEVDLVNQTLREFLSGWKAHQEPVKADFAVLFSHFVIIVADESATHVSGCAGDTLHRRIRTLSNEVGKDFFDRLHFPILRDSGKIDFYTRSALRSDLEQEIISDNDLLMDNTIGNLATWKSKWLVPLKASWLSNQLGLASTP